MWGMIARITTAPGKRDEMISILRGSAANMPGCLSRVVAKDSAEGNKHSLGNRSMGQSDKPRRVLATRLVQDAISRAKPIIANFEKFAATIPVWSTGIYPDRLACS